MGWLWTIILTQLILGFVLASIMTIIWKVTNPGKALFKEEE
ncbi:hypothetical protein SAMN02745691_00865 [Parasporobacterium paucivorans DSM 15970]|uniref:Uncharacterized protein n=1 Tax=Parasporobacterium paucivorans DSM 15970 TaxID=1122934 RepID=A0A1M6E5V9_9FIRM|nr:hypothetical protein SAMN02745691_00865 [Parasporobacterium paucivorans DSM 15970]